MAVRAILSSWLMLSVHAETAVDTLSMVQGRVLAHQQTIDDNLAATSHCMMKDTPERLDPAVAASAEIVVVRGSGEDVRWLDEFPEVPTTVYNRNGLQELLPKARENLRIVPQENVGGQDQCMLDHIINHYDKLPEVTLFMQGWPFWHCGGTIQHVRRALANTKNPTDPVVVKNGAQPGLVPLSATFHQYSISSGWLGNWFNLVDGQRPKTKLSREEVKQDVISSYNATCNEILGMPCPDTHWVSEGAQWAVSRERIHTRDVAYYQRLASVKAAGDEIHQKRLRGLVLEAVWPMIWGSHSWTPGSAAVQGRPNKVLTTLNSVDSLGNYCLFTSEVSSGSTHGRHGVCELDGHAAGLHSETLNMVEGGRWDATMRLRIVPGHKITKNMLELGSQLVEQASDASTASPYCSKRHIWPIATITRVKSQGGKCVERGEDGFTTAACDNSPGQLLHLINNQNGGHFQITDPDENFCFSFDARAIGSASKCKMGMDSGAVDAQRWDLVHQSGSMYFIRTKGATNCLHSGAAGGPLVTGSCEGPSALWEFTDAKSMGQYYDRFEYSLVQQASGLLKMRCTARLYSNDPAASLDFTEPQWRQRGHLAAFSLQDAAEQDGSYYILDRTSATEMYLGCNKTTREATFMSDVKTPWKLNPVSNSFVYVQTQNKVVLQFSSRTGALRCGVLNDDDTPPPDTTFEMQLEPSPVVQNM